MVPATTSELRLGPAVSGELSLNSYLSADLRSRLVVGSTHLAPCCRQSLCRSVVLLFVCIRIISSSWASLFSVAVGIEGGRLYNLHFEQVPR